MNITKKDVTFHIGDKKVTKKGYLIKIKDGEYPPILHNSGKNNIIDTLYTSMYPFRIKRSASVLFLTFYSSLIAYP